MRIRTKEYLKQHYSSSKTFDVIGCDPKFLREYLERQFKVGMSWDNYGSWHIDHIIPLSSAKNKEEIYKLCHYSNLQPLWAQENLSKGNKMTYTNFIPSDEITYQTFSNNSNTTQEPLINSNSS